MGAPGHVAAYACRWRKERISCLHKGDQIACERPEEEDDDDVDDGACRCFEERRNESEETKKER